MRSTTQRLTTARRAILPYTLILLAMSLITQLIITVTGNEVGILAAICTGVMALTLVAFLIRFGRALKQVRFGYLTVHAATYVTVVVPYMLHFFILQTVAASRAESQTAIDTLTHMLYSSGWFGVVISMPACWGVGLLIHMLGALAARGYEAS